MNDSALIQALRRTSAEFVRDYEDNPSMSEAIFKLKQAMQELDLATMTPGQQAARSTNKTSRMSDGDLEALRTGSPSPSGQGIIERSEPRSKVQK